MEENCFQQEIIPTDNDQGGDRRIDSDGTHADARSRQRRSSDATPRGSTRSERTPGGPVPLAITTPPIWGGHHAVIAGGNALGRRLTLPHRRQCAHGGHHRLRHGEGQRQTGDDTGHPSIAASQHIPNLALGQPRLQWPLDSTGSRCRLDQRGKGPRGRSGDRPRRPSPENEHALAHARHHDVTARDIGIVAPRAGESGNVRAPGHGVEKADVDRVARIRDIEGAQLT